MQNTVYADDSGTIGFIAPGLVPIRGKGDGWLPAPGWTGEYDWKGFVPFDALPQATNPASGHFVSANNKIVPDTYPYFLSRDWDLPNRAERIEALLARTPVQNPASSAAIEADTFSLAAKELVPLMTAIAPADAASREAIRRLRHWDFHMDRDQVAPLLFTAWLRQFSHSVLFGRFGEAVAGYWGLKPQVMEAVLTRRPDWCADPKRPGTETCATRLAQSLRAALAELRRAYGDDMATWRWGRAHVAVFASPVFSQIPVLRDWLDPSIPTAGASDTVNHAPSLLRDEPRPVRAGVRREPADHHRLGRARRCADDRHPRPVRQSAVAPLCRSGPPLARFRLAGSQPRRPRLHPRTGARAMNDLPVTIADVRRAAAAIEGAVARTPAIMAPALSALCRRRDLSEARNSAPHRLVQGARGAEQTADPEPGAAARRRRRDVGRQPCPGCRLPRPAARVPATIVMPEGTPFTKIERTEALGAAVVLKGDSLATAREAAEGLGREHGLAFIHPYDDPAVIAGQGTIALELLADQPDLDALVVPIGGGGLISGIAVAAKALNPAIEIVGVQSTLYPSMHRLMRGEEPGPPAQAATLAEGIAVKEPGRLTRRIVEALVSDILLVDEAMLEDAVEILLDRQKLVVEGAGAAGLAAILAAPERFAGKRVGIVLSGGNIDVRLLASILMRGLVHEGRLVRLRAELPDMPGALSRVSGIIGEHAGNIVEVHHQRLFHDTSVKRAELDVVVETQNRRHVEALIAALNAAGFPTRLLLGAADETG